MTYTKPVVAIVGIGGFLGKPIINALTSSLFRDNYTFPIRAITRDISKASESTNDLEFYEAKELNSYVSAFTGVDVVLDLRPAPALKDKTVIDAAKKAQVKLYSTSDYGTDYYKAGRFKTVYQLKVATADYAREQGLKVVQFHSGFFLDMALVHHPNILFIDPENKIADYPGDGSARLSVTSLRDIGRSVAAVISRPVSEIPDEIRLGGDNLSLAEIASVYEKVTGITLERKPKTAEEVIAVADDHLKNGTVGKGQGFFDILRAVSLISDTANNFATTSQRDYVNPGLFKWDTIEYVASNLVGKK